MPDFLDYLRAMASVPTAPYAEHWMLERLRALLGAIPGLEIASDRWGNIAARLSQGQASAPPLALVAHLDHPGFLPAGPPKGNRLPILFEGGVADSYLLGGEIRLFRSSDDPGIPARIVSMGTRSEDAQRNRHGIAEASADPAGARLGMWDLEPLREAEDGRLHSRAIDDLGGCAVMLALLDRLAQDPEASGGPADLICLFTRAEEAGFRGALALCRDPERERLLPNDSLVISVETSSARPTTPIGGGAVLRVGDKSTVFDPAICQLLEAASKQASQEAGSGRRPLARALMDGGSCEATAFNRYGYRAAGVCLPLGNYHNMNTETGRIEEEYIAPQDAQDLVAALVALAQMAATGAGAFDDLRQRLDVLAEAAEPRLLGE